MEVVLIFCSAPSCVRWEMNGFGELVKIVACHVQTGEECRGIHFQHELQNSTGLQQASEGERTEKKKMGVGGSVMNWMFVSQSSLSPLRSGIICKWCRSSFIINYRNHVRQCYSLLLTCGIHGSGVCTLTCQSVPCLFLLFMLPCLTFFFDTIHLVALACTNIFYVSWVNKINTQSLTDTTL